MLPPCSSPNTFDYNTTAIVPLQVLQGTGATRVIANKLVHEDIQKPSDLPPELRHGNAHDALTHPYTMSPEDKHVSGFRAAAWACLDKSNHPTHRQLAHIIVHWHLPCVGVVTVWSHLTN